jgi:hypothetical protein
LLDPSQRLFNHSQETTIGLMQADLKLRFGIGIGLVNEISLEAPSSWQRSHSFRLGGGQLALLGQQ